ncbi:MAG: hypothetical protein M0038_11550 [Pseudomonadota bacterium]|jgi:hypothetical protein|nr:hypothetical protein [Pseudomonadota bacterium]
MADDQVKVWANPQIETVTVQVDGKNVVLGFVTSGMPLNLKRDQLGKVGLAVEAQYYVTMANGLPLRVQKKAELVQEIEQAFDQPGAITWHRSEG